MVASVFCFLTYFELIASVAEPSNLVLEIISGDAKIVHHYTPSEIVDSYLVTRLSPII